MTLIRLLFITLGKFKSLIFSVLRIKKKRHLFLWLNESNQLFGSCVISRSCLSRSALEQFKRWLSPERVAINAEELEYLLLPTQNSETPANSTQTDKPCEEEECPSPEK